MHLPLLLICLCLFLISNKVLGFPDNFQNTPIKITCDPISLLLPLHHQNRLHKITFGKVDDTKTADRVFIHAPKMTNSSKTALGKNGRVKAFGPDPKTPFKFDREYALPVTLYLDGTKASKAQDDFGFAYEYRTKNGKTICSAQARATVVDIQINFSPHAGRGSAFENHNKMLITASGAITAHITPNDIIQNADNIRWRYDGDGQFEQPNRIKTRFRAGTTPTPSDIPNGHALRLQITKAGQMIEAQIPVTITAPMRARADKGWINKSGESGKGGKPIRSAWIDRKTPRFSLFDTSISYQILDQFGAPIKDSAWAGRIVQIRENIGAVLSSPLPRMQNWINNSLNWNPDWIDKPSGRFTDHLGASEIFTGLLFADDSSAVKMPGTQTPLENRPTPAIWLHPHLNQIGAILMGTGLQKTSKAGKKGQNDTPIGTVPDSSIPNNRQPDHENSDGFHIWEASVNGLNPTPITRNHLRVRVKGIKNRQDKQKGPKIRFESEYVINTP
jgi:hypothetical protein